MAKITYTETGRNYQQSLPSDDDMVFDGAFRSLCSTKPQFLIKKAVPSKMILMHLGHHKFNSLYSSDLQSIYERSARNSQKASQHYGNRLNSPNDNSKEEKAQVFHLIEQFPKPLQILNINQSNYSSFSCVRPETRQAANIVLGIPSLKYIKSPQNKNARSKTNMEYINNPMENSRRKMLVRMRDDVQSQIEGQLKKKRDINDEFFQIDQVFKQELTDANKDLIKKSRLNCTQDKRQKERLLLVQDQKYQPYWNKINLTMKNGDNPLTNIKGFTSIKRKSLSMKI